MGLWNLEKRRGLSKMQSQNEWNLKGEKEVSRGQVIRKKRGNPGDGKHRAGEKQTTTTTESEGGLIGKKRDDQ